MIGFKTPPPLKRNRTPDSYRDVNEETQDDVTWDDVTRGSPPT